MPPNPWLCPRNRRKDDHGKGVQSSRQQRCPRGGAHLGRSPCAWGQLWAASGPVFHYSETWQLIINTGTTIVTFLMVFLIQNTQNRDGAAIQAKLDELIRSGRAKNDFIGIEHLTEAEVEMFRARCLEAKRQRSIDLEGPS
ncbi:low affinity iron permease family protein [Mesorhizobium sp. ORM8.1]